MRRGVVGPGYLSLVDMHPFSEWDDPTCTDIDLQAVALYPDTQYKVEPVTKGVRMVLHSFRRRFRRTVGGEWVKRA
jgi:hypothetical protein